MLGYKQKKDRLERLDVDMYTDTPPPGKPAIEITNRMAFSCRREQNKIKMALAVWVLEVIPTQRSQANCVDLRLTPTNPVWLWKVP